jgi:hypothetical protein
MWRMLLVVVAICGCVEPNKSSRWPGHRKDHDARLDTLALQVEKETQQISDLTKRIAELETQLAHVQPPPAAAVPATEPPAATAPDTSK